MNDNTPQRPQQPGQYGGRPDDQYHPPPPPPPPPPPCPEPCEEPPWGPPKIRPECCPKDRECCPPDDQGTCTWNEVDDPCVRAASADCGGEWTTIKCNCESTNTNCTCDEWECGGYPQPTCVPCKPCDGLVPDDKPNPDDCKDPERDCCDSDELRKQLDALNRCITSQQAEQQKIADEIAARTKTKEALATLIGEFDGVVKTYRDQRHQLTCREDVLKIFYRETAKVFQDPYRFPEACLREMQTAINSELCALEKAKCCLKSLDGKLGTDAEGKQAKFTKIIWEQARATKELDRANKAFVNLKTFAKWLDDQFKALEALKDKISDLLYKSTDPQDHNVAFYRFYWEFVPRLCKRFPVAICCKDKDCGEPPQYPPPGQPPGQYPPPGQPPTQYPPQGQPPNQYPPQGQPPTQYPPQGQPPGQPPPQGYGQPPYPPQGQYPNPQPPQGYGQQPYPPQGQNPTQYPPGQYPPPQPAPKPPQRIGCEPGDWHPSTVAVDDLKELICCAWDYVRTKEEQVAKATEAVTRATSNQKLVAEKVKADEPTLDARIEAKVKKVKCTRCGSSTSR